MKELLNEIKQVTQSELVRENRRHPLFNSPHEAYAKIKEEMESAEYKLVLTKDALSQFWSYVKGEGHVTDMLDYLSQMKARAISLAAESIQIATMSQKAMDSLRQSKRSKNDKERAS